MYILIDDSCGEYRVFNNRPTSDQLLDALDCYDSDVHIIVDLIEDGSVMLYEATEMHIEVESKGIELIAQDM